MKKTIINFNKKQREYSIFIGNNLIEKVSELIDLEKYSKILVVTDEIIKPLFLEKLLSELPVDSKSIILPTGEKEKNIKNVQKIWSAMHSAKCDRKSLIINLGGGVITDMGGFAASTYMRGIDFINIPTTLLSQVDASIGGKTGIDFAGIKNMIGTFNQPVGVVIDVQTLKTLPEREFVSGFAEIIKHGLIADNNYFEIVTAKKPREFSQEELIDLIAKSCEIKKQIVQNDEKENGKRKLLNFGHTVGHAIETLSLNTKNPLLHGEAISIGMIAEAKVSQKLGLLSKNDFLKIEKCLKNAGPQTSLRDHEMAKQSLKTIIQKMHKDKKNNKGITNFTLLEKIGKAIIDKQASDEIITESLKYILNKI